MPIITVNTIEGKDKETKRILIQKLTDVTAETLQAPPETIRVIIRDIPIDNYGIGGIPIKEFLKK